MKDGAVVKRNAMLLGVRYRIGPVFRALGQADEVGHTDRGLVREKGAGHLASGGVDDGCGSGCRRGRWLGGSGRGRLLGRGGLWQRVRFVTRPPEINRQIKKQIRMELLRMDAPESRASPGRAGETPALRGL